MLSQKTELKQLINSRFPFIRTTYRYARWRLLLFLQRLWIRKRADIKGLHTDPYQIYWINPKKIKRAIYWKIDGLSMPDMGIIKGGDWDKQAVPVEELDIVRAALHRFSNGGEWKDTEYYKKYLREISTGKRPRGCGTEDGLRQYFMRFDKLYDEIKSCGYKMQSELPVDEFAGRGIVEDEILTLVDRNGNYIFHNGAHRFSIALALGLEKIPVMVMIRHKKWQEFIIEIMEHAKKNNGKMYQPITHHDLCHLSSAHGEKRYELIKEHLPSSKGNLLDIGANWGYFCHRFEMLGFDCYAAENDPEHLYFLERLKIAEERDFKIIKKSILEYRERKHFDVVLALNIFHHFLKHKDDYDALISFLKDIDIETMFFEPHKPEESQMIGAHLNYEPDEFVDFIKEHSTLNCSEFIGKAEDGRPIYKLWK